MTAAQYGLIAVCVAGTTYVLVLAYLGYAEARNCLIGVRLKWQRYWINRHLARHGIAHDQVLPALMQLESFSFECGGEICTFRRGENSTFDLVPREKTDTTEVAKHDGLARGNQRQT